MKFDWYDPRTRRGLAIAGAVLFLAGLSLGGAPWHASFWIAIAAFILVLTPFVGGAIFFWNRMR